MQSHLLKNELFQNDFVKLTIKDFELNVIFEFNSF
jgi:hypothetical protein